MKAYLYLILTLFLYSCNEKSIEGHWHEYVNNNIDYSRCIIVKDSTYYIDKFTLGYLYEIPYLNNSELLKHVFRLDTAIVSNPKFQSKKIIFNDSIYWKRKKDNTETFLSDFSAGMKLKVAPYISNFEPSDTLNDNFLGLTNFIYAGKSKKEFTNNFIDSTSNYIQLNDQIKSNFNDVINFIACNHCDFKEISTVLKVDKEVPYPFLDSLYSKMKTFPIDTNRIYVEYADTINKKVGYKKFSDLNQLTNK